MVLGQLNSSKFSRWSSESKVFQSLEGRGVSELVECTRRAVDVEVEEDVDVEKEKQGRGYRLMIEGATQQRELPGSSIPCARRLVGLSEDLVLVPFRTGYRAIE